MYDDNLTRPAIDDDDGDSQMQSALTDLDKPVTPNHPHLGSIDISPPNSQGMPTASIGANANGKRPLSTVDIGEAPMRVAVEPPKIKTHEQSGYTWVRQEEEPGWAWKNKRAVDEANRAYEGLLMKDFGVGNRYGDPFEMADRELTQQ